MCTHTNKQSAPTTPDLSSVREGIMYSGELALARQDVSPRGNHHLGDKKTHSSDILPLAQKADSRAGRKHVL